MLFFVSILLVIAGIYLKKSKGLYILQFSWMWLILSFCNDFSRIDYQNYVRAYTQYGRQVIEIQGSEWGYALLNRWFYQWGFSFETANSIFVFISLFLFAYSIPKYVKNYNIPASLFMLFPLLLNGIQIRNTLSAAIIVWGIQFLISESKIDTIKYILVVAVAMSFHATAFFYYIFLLAKYVSFKKIQIIVVVLLVSIFSVFNYISPLLSKIMGEDRFENKMTHGTNTWVECIPAIIWALFLLVTVWLMYIHLKKQVIDQFHHGFVEIMLKIDMLLLILLPIMVFDYSFERLFRNVVILNYCFFVFYFETFKLNRSRLFYFNVLCSVLYIFYCIVAFEVVFSSRFDTIVKVYLNNNYLISDFKNMFLIISLILYLTLFGFIFDKQNIVLVKKKKKITFSLKNKIKN